VVRHRIAEAHPDGASPAASAKKSRLAFGVGDGVELILALFELLL
jgi:hypothetical protein